MAGKAAWTTALEGRGHCAESCVQQIPGQPCAYWTFELEFQKAREECLHPQEMCLPHAEGYSLALVGSRVAGTSLNSAFRPG